MKQAIADLLFDLKRLCADDAGATAVEYALVAGGISIAIAVVAGALGDTLVESYTDVLEALETANGG